MNADILYWRILWWAVVCCWSGYSVGRTVDVQYHEREGKPTFVSIPEHLRIFFHFRYFLGNEVVREGVITQILGYTFGLVEIVLFVFSTILKLNVNSLQIADWIVILYVFILTLVLLPMHIRYERNMQRAYDCDWITQLQENLTIYPKRQCKIVSTNNTSTCIITLGRWGKRKFVARATIPVYPGTVLFAVHSSENGPPFWTITEH